jgi:hypothetical protein
MKINWHQNPFWTTVELDERDKERILIAYQNEEYTNILCNLNMRLNGDFSDPPLTDIEEIKKLANKWGSICNLDVESKEIQSYIKELELSHMGDCTCVPCTCFRCLVEDMLGIDTLKGLGKHQASKVLGAFGKEGNKTIDEAIESLEQPMSYVKTDVWKAFTQEQYESHIPRWENERVTAVAWLKKYKEEHNF